MRGYLLYSLLQNYIKLRFLLNLKYSYDIISSKKGTLFLKIILCVDNDYGMLFNGRRQSRDELIYDDIISFLNDCNLWMSQYSSKLFKNHIKKISVDNNFFNKANENDYCFIEDPAVLKDIEKISSFIVYKWNKKYPSDVKFSPNLNGFKLVEKVDFKGKSHEKITKEVYIR